MNTDAIRRFLTAISSAVEIERGQLYQLVQSAETSFYFRDIHSQLEIGLLLQSFGYPFSQVGKFYESIYLYRTGQLERARQLLECVAESAPAHYRSKALLSLSAVEAHIGRFEESLRLRLQVASSRDIDPITLLVAQRGIAALRGLEGDHRAALRDLERLLPLAHLIGKRGHPVYVDFLNSYLVELRENRRMTEAEQVAGVVAASPLISRYPEWQETVSEIETERRRPSGVAITESIPRDPRIQSVIDFMKANYQRKLDLKELAAVAKISRPQFSRVFKREVGLSPVKYLIRLRMEKARELLKNPALNIQEIMTLTGYDTRSNFINHFHQYFGSAPIELRDHIK